MPQATQCTTPGSHPGSLGHCPPTDQPGPADVAPGSRDLQPSLSRTRSAPATLQHRSVLCFLPTCLLPCPASPPALPRLSARNQFTAPVPRTAPAGSTCRQEQAGAPCCCRRVGGGTPSTSLAGDATYAEEHQYVCARGGQGGQGGLYHQHHQHHRHCRRGRRFLLGQKKVIA